MSTQTKAQKRAAFKRLVSRIEKSNQAFEAATPAQRIVMVSRDVLSMLRLGRIEAELGTYVHVPQTPKVSFERGDQVSEILKKPSLPACQVCAIGAGMVAATLRLNKVQLTGSIYSFGIPAGYYEADQVFADNRVGFGMSERARDVFPSVLLKRMEHAFENGHYGYDRLKTDRARLRAIYQNLIDNQGEKFTDYKNPKYAVYSLGNGF